MESHRGPSCESARAHLSLLLGSDLPIDEDRRLRQHLLDCRDCRRELGAWLRTRKALSGLAPAEGVGQEFFAQLNSDILSRLREEGRSPPRTAGTRRRWPRVSAAAAAVALFFIGLHFGLEAANSGSSLLDGPPISQPAPSLYDPASPTRPVGNFRDADGLPSTVRATLERAAKEAEDISDHEKAEFARRYESLRLKRALWCGEIPPNAGLELEPTQRECWELLRKCLQETRKGAATRSDRDSGQSRN